LTAFSPKLAHLTCLVHGFHRVSETIRYNYSEVDQLIATIKKIFLKAPSRVSKFKEIYPDLNLPPEPIITRWGTWLKAVQFYCDHFDKIKNVISNHIKTIKIISDILIGKNQQGLWTLNSLLI